MRRSCGRVPTGWRGHLNARLTVCRACGRLRLMGTVMRDDTSQRSHRLAVTQPVHPTTTTTRSPRTADGQGRGCAGPDEPCYPSLTALTGMWSSALYNRPRMGADAIGPTGRLAMTLRVTRVTSSLACRRRDARQRRHGIQD